MNVQLLRLVSFITHEGKIALHHIPQPSIEPELGIDRCEQASLFLPERDLRPYLPYTSAKRDIRHVSTNMESSDDHVWESIK